MKIVHISDTHGNHLNFTHSIATYAETADVIVHSGDFSEFAIEEETDFFLRWFRGLPIKHKILVAGNHDTTFIKGGAKQFNLTGIHYLENQELEIEGIKFFGSPYTRNDFGGAFTHYDDDDLSKYWQLIPTDTDVLITHTPPIGMLDKSENEQRGWGSQSLNESLKELKNIKAHLFGHVHQARGVVKENSVIFSNAATKINLIEV